MAPQVTRTHEIPFLGSFACHSMVFGTWATLAFIESCVPRWSDPIIHCRQSVRFYLVFACGVIVLAGFLAWLSSTIYYPIKPFPTTISELPSTLRFNFMMGVVSYGLIRWKLYAPNMARQFWEWLGISLLVVGILLILINHFSRQRGQS